jgi:hypothetical protein
MSLILFLKTRYASLIINNRGTLLSIPSPTGPRQRRITRAQAWRLLQAGL